MMKTFRYQYNVEVVHAWGMTEMSPLGTACILQSYHMELPEEQQQWILEKQGHAIYGVDMKIVDDAGKELAWDGKTVTCSSRDRGSSAVISRAKAAMCCRTAGFPTGDVATISHDGYMQITDRSKDVIKSGGEWIGSIDLENIQWDIRRCIRQHASAYFIRSGTNVRF